MTTIKESLRAVALAAALLKKGGVVVCATDTVYGFLADASNKKAVEKIYKIKKRPKSKPLSVFVKDIKMAKEIAIIDEKQEKRLKKYWPGKYTFILKLKVESRKLKVFGIKKNSIALRIPKYKFLNDLLKKINRPLVQTSVNISTQEPLNSAEQIIATFKKNKLISLMIDGGELKKNIPSQIHTLNHGVLTRIR